MTLMTVMASLAALPSCRRLPPTAASKVEVAGRSPGQLKGYAEFDRFYAGFIRNDSEGLLDAAGLSGTQELSQLLGAFGGPGGAVRFQNGALNSTNVFILRAVFSRISADLADLPGKQDGCPSIGRPYAVAFSDLVESYCRQPSEPVLRKFWLHWMGIENESGFEGWLADYLATPGRLTAAADDLFVIYFSLFMNPYFLLEN